MADEPDTGKERSVTTPAAEKAPSEQPKPRRAPGAEAEAENSIEPARQRTADRAAASGEPAREAGQTTPSSGPKAADKEKVANDKAANDDSPERFSVQRGDVPDAIKRRYYSEEPQFAPEMRYFTDAKTKETAFRDAGDKLVARQNNGEVVKDLVAIAEHRGWKSIEVKGQEDFRREVWLEARTAGLEVRGYTPSERDIQELERRTNARDTNTIAPSKERAQEVQADPARGAAERAPGAAPAPAQPERLDYDKGVTGKLLESGEQPYKHRAGQELSPYVRVEQSNGRQVEVWGVGLPDALERSGAKVGDNITLRRDGIEIVSKTIEVKDRTTGEITLEKRDVPRNKWTVEADRFRAATPAEAARDPDLRDAQSRLAVVAAVVKDRHPDPAVQDRLIASAKDQIAAHIEQGAKIAPAVIRDPEAAKGRPALEASNEGVRGTPSETSKSGPERTRGR